MPSALSQDSRELARELFMQGLSVAVISRKIGLNANTVSTWTKRGKWAELRSKLEHNLDGPGEKLACMTRAERSAAIREALSEELREQVAILRGSPVQSVKELATTKQGQGRAAVAKIVAETASLVHDWSSEVTPGLILAIPMPLPERRQDTPDLQEGVEVADG
jgi:IS30 family transposase